MIRSIVHRHAVFKTEKPVYGNGMIERPPPERRILAAT